MISTRGNLICLNMGHVALYYIWDRLYERLG
jgi:hypothetical protein